MNIIYQIDSSSAKLISTKGPSMSMINNLSKATGAKSSLLELAGLAELFELNGAVHLILESCRNHNAPEILYKMMSLLLSFNEQVQNGMHYLGLDLSCTNIHTPEGEHNNIHYPIIPITNTKKVRYLIPDADLRYFLNYTPYTPELNLLLTVQYHPKFYSNDRTVHGYWVYTIVSTTSTANIPSPDRENPNLVWYKNALVLLH